MPNEKDKNFKMRPPVVAVMGHVDHGKTTLLDYIKKTNIAAKEAGGITQSISAYEIEHRTTNTEQAKRITFIDTPGHEAFTRMRAAGAHAADLAILIVAADEGVKPQTRETIELLKSTQTPFIVAITKIDRTNADIERVKSDLAAAGVLLEGHGGNVSYHGISSKTGEGVNDLLDLILLAAELEGLTYNPAAFGTGYVLEATMDSRRGIQATVILQDGALREEDWIVTPTTTGRVKLLENFLGERVKELVPSAPALVVGFETLPRVGETFVTAPSEETACAELKKVAVQGATALQKEVSPDAPSLETPNLLKLILKADDVGSLAALSATVRNLDVKDKLYVVKESVGDVTDGDVKLAHASGASIIGFKTRVASAAKKLADSQAVTILTSAVIYELLKAIEEFVSKPKEDASAGELEVLAVFNHEKLHKQLVGGKVTCGTLKVNMQFEVQRAGEVVGKGKILRMKVKKTEITQAATGVECGILANASVAIEVGDRIVVKR